MTDSQQILDTLSEQVQCYARLAKLAEIQHECVQNNQTDELLNVLMQRQTVLEQISYHETTIGPVKKRWVEFIGELPESDRAGAENLLGETRRLLEQITQSDRNDTMILQQRKLNLGKQINQATQARQVNRSYAAAAYGRPASKMDIQR